MEKEMVLSKIQELLEKIQALADTLMMIGKLDEGETQIKPATIEILGKMINRYVIRIMELMDDCLHKE